MRKKLMLLLPVALLLIITTTLCFSEEDKTGKTSISDIIATTSETHLILFGMVNNSFTQEMIDGLRSGVPVHFSFFIELNKKEEKWPDKKLATLEFRHTMSYDTLKESYRVELEEVNKKSLSFPTLDEAQRTMKEVNGVKIIELAKLQPDSSYQLRIRAELFEKTLPMSLQRILPFLSWWDIETGWYSIEFNY